MITITVLPIPSRLTKRGVPGWLAMVLSILMVVLLLALVIATVFFSVTSGEIVDREVEQGDEGDLAAEEVVVAVSCQIDRGQQLIERLHRAGVEVDRAEQLAGESLKVRREIGEFFTVPLSLDLLGTARRSYGDMAGAVEAHQEGLRIAREHRNELQEGFLLAALALDSLEEGKLKEAELSAERPLVLARRLRNRKMQAVALRVLVATALGTGQAREAASRAVSAPAG